MSILTAASPSVEELRQKLESIPDLNRVGLGWLRFSCSVHHLDYWKEKIVYYFRCPLHNRGKGWLAYLDCLVGGFSTFIGYAPFLTEAERQELGGKQSPNEGYMTVDVPQSALDSLSSEDLCKFLLDVYGCEGVKFRRVDVYYDDYCKIISPEQVQELCKSGRVGVPRIERMRSWEEYNLRKRQADGYTVYFGSPKSGKQIRFYDKFAESDGLQDCYRWEAELKGDRAESFQTWFAEVLGRAVGAATLEETANIITNAYKQVIKGAISFHELPENVDPKNLPQNWATRTPLTWWWKELLAGLEPAKLTVSRVKPSLEGLVAWIRHQVMPGMALLRSVYPNWGILFSSWLDRELEQGEERWSDRHFQMFAQALITSPAT
jgi:Replication initiation factor